MWITLVERLAGRRGGLRMNCDLTYFRRRASEERTAALHAKHPHARRVHVAMAECYEELVRAIVAREFESRLEPAASH